MKGEKKQVSEIIEGRDIICISPRYWDDAQGANQHFMKILSRNNNRVLFIEPPLPYLFTIRHRERWSRWSKLFAFRRGLVQTSDNLWMTTSPPSLPFKGAFSTMANANRWLILKWIRRATKQLGFSQPILWLFTPPSVWFIGKLDEDFVIYHCLDEFTKSPFWAHQRNIVELERSLLDKADLVITCSENVYDAKAPWCGEIINVQNGVDFDHFHSAMDETTPIAPRLNKDGTTIIGFYGTINYRMDEDFLIKAARRYPEYRFAIVGPEEQQLSELRLLPNVMMLGHVALSELPTFLKGFDVCLIPYKMSEFVKNVSPLKVYEYLAAGKPVVSPDIRAVRNLKDLILIGHDHEEMVGLIALALESNNEEAEKARVQRARQNTWQHRVAIVSKKISELS